MSKIYDAALSSGLASETIESVWITGPPRARWKRAVNVVRRRFGMTEWVESYFGWPDTIRVSLNDDPMTIRWNTSGTFEVEEE